jgi:WD40 repeat protein
MVARVWKVEDNGEIKIEKVKNFTEILMNSKFNIDKANLVATGGFSSIITVWDCESDSCKEVATFDHSSFDQDFNGLEIEWQNNKNVAVAGRSKFIYLWSIDQPKSPI